MGCTSLTQPCRHFTDLRRLGFWQVGIASVLLPVALVTWSGVAFAEETADAPESPPDPARSGFSPVLLAGWTEGLAAGAQVDLGRFAVRPSVGYLPVFAVLETSDPGEQPDIELLHSYQVNADALWYFASLSSGTRIGAGAGYRYNSVLGHGGSLGGYAEVAVASSVDLLGELTLMLFPQARERLEDELDGGEHVPVNAIVGLQFGLGLGLKF